MRFLFALALAVTIGSAHAQEAGGLKAPTPEASAAPNLDAMRKARSAAQATFLNRAASKEARLATVPLIQNPDLEIVPALLAIGRNRAEDDRIRLEALRLVPWSEEYLDAALKILNDPADGGVILDAGLIEDVNRRTTFRIPPRMRQRIQTVLRKLLDDRRDRVRLYAYRSLATNHDTVALSRLTDALRRGRDFPVPVTEALDLLRIDGSVFYVDTIRPYLNHDDPEVRERAALSLGVDPQSRGRLIEMARSPEVAQDIRVSALRGLARADTRFPSYALPIVENGREDPEVRYAAMRAMAGRMNYNRVETQDQIRFAEAVEKIFLDPGLRDFDGGKLSSGARKLHQHLLRAFPAIKKHYESR